MIKTLHLFPVLDRKLLELLRSLSLEDWQRPTIAGNWRVKDIAAHLLDGNMRWVSMGRDNFFGETPEKADTYTDLVHFLNGLNADWVKAFQRISPPLLIELLGTTGAQYISHLESLDPTAKALFSVAWAGEEESQNHFHIAREYTEKWHHQQQIRLALDKDNALLADEFYLPFLETSVRALPHFYRKLEGHAHQSIKIEVDECRDASWHLNWKDGKWELDKKPTGELLCEINLPAKIAWRVFMKGIDIEEAKKQCEIKGDQTLANPFFATRAVMV